MSDFPKDLQTDLTKMMKLLDEAGLCAPAGQVDPSTMLFTNALKDADNAIWAASASLRAWQLKMNFSAAKLPPVLAALADQA